jgi:hypothetical protein
MPDKGSEHRPVDPDQAWEKPLRDGLDGRSALQPHDTFRTHSDQCGQPRPGPIASQIRD